MENQSFDHMLGYLNLQGSCRIPCEGLQADAGWLAAHANTEGGLLYRSHWLDQVVQVIADPVHSRGPIATQISTPNASCGQMGGFVKSYAELTTYSVRTRSRYGLL